MELLWKNEARLCSRISDIQDLGFGMKAGHSMFFLETILVPPTKFRPPTKGGDDSVSIKRKMSENLSPFVLSDNYKTICGIQNWYFGIQIELPL